MSEDRLLWLARVIGLAGLGLLIFSSVGGVMMSSRFTAKVSRKFAWLKGNRIFRYHRLFALIGAVLFLLHPVPTLFASKTTGGLNLRQMLVPFSAQQQAFYTGLGSLAFYVLAIVTVSSLLIKWMKFSYWRVLHYGTYLLLALGLAHGLLISAEYKPGERFDFGEPEKLLLLAMTAVVLCFPAWRLFIKFRRANAVALDGPKS